MFLSHCVHGDYRHQCYDDCTCLNTLSFAVVMLLRRVGNNRYSREECTFGCAKPEEHFLPVPNLSSAWEDEWMCVCVCVCLCVCVCACFIYCRELR